MRKYYFAYHNFHGMIFGLSWPEDDGHCVGERPTNMLKNIDGTDVKWEITEEDHNGTLADLEKKHPIPLPSLLKTRLD